MIQECESSNPQRVAYLLIKEHNFWLVPFIVKIRKIDFAELPNFPAKFGVWPLAGWMWWGPAQPPPPNSRPTLHFQNEADSSTRTDPQPFWGNFVEKTVGTKFDKLVWICKVVASVRNTCAWGEISTAVEIFAPLKLSAVSKIFTGFKIFGTLKVRTASNFCARSWHNSDNLLSEVGFVTAGTASGVVKFLPTM